ncbi:hypothetical protein CRUP_028611, partial [Coryphaenoides rupestris]
EKGGDGEAVPGGDFPAGAVEAALGGPAGRPGSLERGLDHGGARAGPRGPPETAHRSESAGHCGQPGGALQPGVSGGHQPNGAFAPPLAHRGAGLSLLPGVPAHTGPR